MQAVSLIERLIVCQNGGFVMGTVIVGGILLVVVGLIVRSMIKDKKNGKSLQCGGDCKNCCSHCR